MPRATSFSHVCHCSHTPSSTKLAFSLQFLVLEKACAEKKTRINDNLLKFSMREEPFSRWLPKGTSLNLLFRNISPNINSIANRIYCWNNTSVWNDWCVFFFNVWSNYWKHMPRVMQEDVFLKESLPMSFESLFIIPRQSPQTVKRKIVLLNYHMALA